MPGAKCAICDKTAYPTESLNTDNKVFHKACFRCKKCKRALDIKNYRSYEGAIWCIAHLPKPKATIIADDKNVVERLSAPRKAIGEGARGVQKDEAGKIEVQKTKLAQLHEENLSKAKSSGHDQAGDDSAPADDSPVVDDAPAQEDHVEEDAPAEEAADEPAGEPALSAEEEELAWKRRAGLI